MPRLQALSSKVRRMYPFSPHCAPHEFFNNPVGVAVGTSAAHAVADSEDGVVDTRARRTAGLCRDDPRRVVLPRARSLQHDRDRPLILQRCEKLRLIVPVNVKLLKTPSSSLVLEVLHAAALPWPAVYG